MPSNKSLYNFYFDDTLKKQLQDKLTRLMGSTEKGALSSLIRVLLLQFNATPDEKVNRLLIDAIAAEYAFSQHKNKRSRL